MKPQAGRSSDTRPLPTRLAGPGESPGFLLWKVSNAWQRRQRAALQPLGLTHSQFVLLATTTWFGSTETLTQARLAELTGVDVMTTSQVLRTLEGAKLVERDTHPDDPRAKTIAVTARGRELAREAIVVVEATDDAFFAPVAARVGEVVRLFTELARSAADDAPMAARRAALGRGKPRRKGDRARRPPE